MRAAPPPADYNFAAAVLRENEGRSAKVAFVDDKEELSYGALAVRARRFAGAVANAGVRPEERVLVVLEDTVDLPTVFLGALYAGVVPVLVNTLLPASDYAFMLDHSRARLVVASGSLLPKVARAMVEAHSDAHVLVSRALEGTKERSLEAAVESAPPRERHEPTSADDIAFWLYSSGSTGKPKGTVHTHANVHYTVELYAKAVLGLHESDVVFSAAKLFFAYGLGMGLTFPLSVGATVVLMAGRPTPSSVFDQLTRADHRPTVFAGVPTLYLAMLASPALPSRTSVALRVCTSAGETLPERVGQAFTATFGAPILDGLGSTEMLHIYLSLRQDDVRYGTTGVPVDGYTIELRDEEGRVVDDGELGDLYVKGPSAALLYWRDHARSRATFQGEWVKTGDRFSRLPSGHYRYAGRSDDMLKVSGQYVAPVDVEIALQEHAAVLEAAVVGRLDANGLMRIVAFVVLREGHAGGDELVSALQSFVKATLAPHKYPRDIFFVAELPKTATGKIQRFKLR